MSGFMERLTGMNALTDQVIATDMLISAKSAITQYARAITETATPEVRKTLIQHLEGCIQFHKQIADYMMDQEYYYPLDTSKQLKVDLNIAEQALQLMQDS